MRTHKMAIFEASGGDHLSGGGVVFSHPLHTQEPHRKPLTEKRRGWEGLEGLFRTPIYIRVCVITCGNTPFPDRYLQNNPSNPSQPLHLSARLLIFNDLAVVEGGGVPDFDPLRNPSAPCLREGGIQ